MENKCFFVVAEEFSKIFKFSSSLFCIRREKAVFDIKIISRFKIQDSRYFIHPRGAIHFSYISSKKHEGINKDKTGTRELPITA